MGEHGVSAARLAGSALDLRHHTTPSGREGMGAGDLGGGGRLALPEPRAFNMLTPRSPSCPIPHPHIKHGVVGRDCN